MVFGFGRKQQQVTFKQRVAEFWEWYPTVAERYFNAIEDGTFGDLAPEFSELVEQKLPTMCWVFGPGENGGHSFTLTGEGVRPRQLLTQYWCQQAPEIPGWTFYSSRQPSDAERLKGMGIGISQNEQVDVESFLVKTDVDAENEKIHITAWHPAYARVPAEHHMQILFLLLDEALGEFGTEMWIGNIEIEPVEPGEHVRSLADLPEFIRQMNEYHKWEKLEPLDEFTLYEIGEQSRHRRGDVFIGTTCIPSVINDFLNDNGRLSDDPLAGTGAELLYIRIDGSVFPEGSEAHVRGNIEDALDDALRAQASGRILGGAMGRKFGYVDVLIFDGEASRHLIEETLNNLQLQNRSAIELFL